MAFVVVRHRAATALLDRQARLRAVQSLYLALLIGTQHERSLRGVEIQPHDIDDLLDELRVVAELERARQVRLEAVGLPDSPHHRSRHVQLRRQRPHRPVRGIGGLGLRRPFDDQAGHLVGSCRPSSAAGSILFDAGQPLFGEPSPPETHCWPRDAKVGGDIRVVPALGRLQHDLCPQHQPHGSRSTLRPTGQRASFFLSQSDRYSLAHGCIAPPDASLYTRKAQCQGNYGALH